MGDDSFEFASEIDTEFRGKLGVAFFDCLGEGGVAALDAVWGLGGKFGVGPSMTLENASRGVQVRTGRRLHCEKVLSSRRVRGFTALEKPGVVVGRRGNGFCEDYVHIVYYTASKASETSRTIFPCSNRNIFLPLPASVKYANPCICPSLHSPSYSFPSHL